tara:strand:+ start:272 stop:895 length:624 start_codon:yes stop_codon:yes gene_type:complete
MKMAYQGQFKKYGINPRTLGWIKGRQELRFEALTKYLKSSDVSVLDFGCGFGDLAKYFADKNLNVYYTGIDCVPEFIETARYQQNGTFILSKSIDDKIENNFDYVICSGAFNYLYDENIEVHQNTVFSIIFNLFESCNMLLSFDFQSPYVDFKGENAYHQDIQSLFEFISKNLSKRFIFDHSYMPYEFCVHVYKDPKIKIPDNTFDD